MILRDILQHHYVAKQYNAYAPGVIKLTISVDYSLVIITLYLVYLNYAWSGLERSPRKWKVGCSNPSRDRPKSLKQVEKAPLLHARQ